MGSASHGRPRDNRLGRMGRWEHTGKRAGSQTGRRLGIGALAFGAAYLVWRVGWSLRASRTAVAWWLAVPAIGIEVIGFAAMMLLIWAMSGRTRLARPASTTDANPALTYDVAVVAFDCAVEDARATLVALQIDPAAADAPVQTLLVDHGSRDDLVRLAAEFGADYLAADAADPSGIGTAAAGSGAAALVLLGGGDIPARGMAAALRSWCTDPTVAAVQAVVAATPGDSAEHGPNGRHDLLFERVALNPGLGSRGAAFLSGSGSLIRRSALESIELPSGSRYDVLWQLTSRLIAGGHRVVAAGGEPLVAVAPLASPAAVADDRSARVSAAWRLLAGPDGALRSRGIRRTDRLAIAAWAVRPLESVRRAALVAVVLGALLAGRAPFAPSVAAIAGLWLPAFGLGAVSLMVLSGGSLRPGDRLRGSVRSVRMSLSLAIAINAVLVVRGISDRFTHAMRPLDHTTHVGLVIVGLWVLAGCLESLRLLARRRHGRRAQRLPSSTTGRLGDLVVHIADITMLGAGLLVDHRPELGERHALVFSLPSESGITSLDVPAIVRNVGMDPAGSWRVGVEFELGDGYTLNTLAECCVVTPARASLHATAGRSDHAAIGHGVATDENGPRRLALRLATLLALGAVISSAAPLDAQAGEPLVKTVSGVVVAVTPADQSAETPTSSITISDVTSTDVTSTDVTSTAVTNTAVTIAADTTLPTTRPSATSPSEVTTTSSAIGTVPPPSSLVNDPKPAVDPPSAAGFGGITVVGACSTDPGLDGVYGTSDDLYGATVSTVTDADGHYSLVLEGDACWVSVEPPVPAETMVSSSTPAPAPLAATVADEATVVDLGGSATVTMPPLRVTWRPGAAPGVAGRASGKATIADHVWNDINADGIRQSTEAGVADATLTLYDRAGRTVATQVTDGNGSFRFAGLSNGWYSLGVSNLPGGLRAPHTDPIPSRGALFALDEGEHLAAGIGVVPVKIAAISAVTSEAANDPAAANDPVVRLPAVRLPAPASGQLNHPSGSRGGGPAMVVVIAMAGVLAGSLLFATARPIRARRRTLQ